MPSNSFSTSFGRCTIAWNEKGITNLNLLDTTDSKTDETPPAWVSSIIDRVQRHFDGDPQDFADVRFDFSAVSPFQKRVYAAALQVKAGETRTYGWLAETIGSGTTASRAVGTALARNPWLLLIPCHRFIGSNGKLTGFSAPGGIATKRLLLALERTELPLVIVPL